MELLHPSHDDTMTEFPDPTDRDGRLGERKLAIPGIQMLRKALDLPTKKLTNLMRLWRRTGECARVT
jgi:hypothetical protein